VIDWFDGSYLVDYWLVVIGDGVDWLSVVV